MRLLLTVVRSEGITALVATHDEALIDLADEVLRLEDGRILAQEPRGPGQHILPSRSTSNSAHWPVGRAAVRGETGDQTDQESRSTGRRGHLAWPAWASLPGFPFVVKLGQASRSI
jgi:energy-coupling factor transporter ATP-binding protein EcfA2